MTFSLGAGAKGHDLLGQREEMQNNQQQKKRGGEEGGPIRSFPFPPGEGGEGSRPCIALHPCLAKRSPFGKKEKKRRSISTL